MITKKKDRFKQTNTIIDTYNFNTNNKNKTH